MTMPRESSTSVREAGSAGRTERFPETSPAETFADTADAIISIDVMHRITGFNEMARIIFGYSAEEIVGAPLEMLLPERFRESHRLHVDRFSEGQQMVRHMAGRSTRIYGRRKNGEEFPTDAAISKMEVGGRMQLTVCLRDISEEQRSKNEQHVPTSLPRFRKYCLGARCPP